MSLRSKLLGFVAFILIGALVFGYFLLTQTHTDFTLQDSVAEFDAHEFNQFIEKLNEAERGELGDNVYTVSGKVESKTGFGFILSGGIVCTTADSSDLMKLTAFDKAIVGWKILVTYKFLDAAKSHGHDVV